MNPTPITHLLTDTVSSHEDYSGDCDLCLISMSAEYVSYLLAWMDKAAQIHGNDSSICDIRCWDGRPQYLRFNDKLEQLHNVDGKPVDASLDEPVLLAADPGFAEKDFQRVECQTVHVSPDSIWWSACIKHTSIKIESAAIDKNTLLRIGESFGEVQPTSPATEPVHPAIQQIHDVLFLDTQDGQESYNADKTWDADTVAAIAEVVAEYIPPPSCQTHKAQQDTYTRSWKCPRCRRSITCSYENLAEASVPICTECDTEMEME